MDPKRSTFVLATLLLALTALALAASVASAAGCGSCHYRPGNCPTLTNSEFFGYHPTVWQLWPGPLDPNTSYPGTTPSQPVPADPTSKMAPPSALNRSTKMSIEQAAHSPPATVKDILEKSAIKPPSVSTYTATPSR